MHARNKKHAEEQEYIYLVQFCHMVAQQIRFKGHATILLKQLCYAL